MRATSSAARASAVARASAFRAAAVRRRPPGPVAAGVQALRAPAPPAAAARRARAPPIAPFGVESCLWRRSLGAAHRSWSSAAGSTEPPRPTVHDASTASSCASAPPAPPVQCADAGGAVLVGAAVALGLVGGVALLGASRDRPLPMPKTLAAAGVRVDERLRLRTSAAKGNGLVVTAPVAAGEPLIKVPAEAVLSGDLANQILGPRAAQLRGDTALCALLAEARRDAELADSKDILGLREYLLALPRDFPGLPFWLSDEHAEQELRGTVALPASRALRDRAEGERALALEALASGGEGELEALWSPQRWRWAQATLLTRAGPTSTVIPSNQGKVEEEEGPCAAIVPLIDFVNCSSVPTASCNLIDISGRQQVWLIAAKDLKRGEEVTISYGQQNQEQSLFTFGFSLPESKKVISAPLPLHLHDIAAAEAAGAVGAGGGGAAAGGAAAPLRGALLRMVALSRGDEEDGSGSDGGAPAMARLCWKNAPSSGSGASRGKAAPEVDWTELVAAANILSMDEAALRVARDDCVASFSSPRDAFELPAMLVDRPANAAAHLRLQELLEAWVFELSEPPNSAASSSSSKTSKLPAGAVAPLRAYRASCLALAEAALQRLREESPML